MVVSLNTNTNVSQSASQACYAEDAEQLSLLAVQSKQEALGYFTGPLVSYNLFERNWYGSWKGVFNL